MSGIIRVNNLAGRPCRQLARQLAKQLVWQLFRQLAIALPMACAANVARADTLLQLAASSDRLTQFVAEMQAAGLDATLNLADSLTVFAPTNEAFMRLPIPMQDALMVDGARMKALLSDHIVPRPTSEIPVGGSHNSLIGRMQTMPVSLLSGNRSPYAGIHIEQRVKIVQTLQADNGTLYLIDDVLMPYAPQ